MKIQQLLSYVRKAIDEYQMIDEGDRIAVGISGGKDSLALLIAMRHLQYFYPKKFELHAITVSLGFDGFDLSGIRKLCDTLEVPYTVHESDIGKIIFEERKEKNPCSLCAKMRKGALNEVAKRLQCNKVAYGHNRDDINETLLMSLLYEGRIHTFSPVTYLDRMDLHMIRPLMYVPEQKIRLLAKQQEFPIVKSPCPADGNTKRQEIKEMIMDLDEKLPGVSQRMFGAIQRSNIYGWEKKSQK